MKSQASVLMMTLFAALAGIGAVRAASGPAQQSSKLDEVVNRIIASERDTVKAMSDYSPRVETYIQEEKPQKNGEPEPVVDYYFLGVMRMGQNVEEYSMLPGRGFGRTLANLIQMKPQRELIGLHFHPDVFGYPVTPDPIYFDRLHYRFDFVRREFLGDVRCLAFDLTPLSRAKEGLFVGRIWVEDQGYHIVRFNGTYAAGARFNVHFDSWRQNLQPGLWLPVYIYSAESSLAVYGVMGRGYRSQTRFWGYQLKPTNPDEELTQVLVDAPKAVEDESKDSHDYSPLESKRMWVNEAEENIINRLEKGGLVAPPGAVDKVLETVVNNLIATNHMDSLPPIHCRVLLTYPLESLTVGDTILVSRGLIDVLPNEASLAMILGHELAHISLGQSVDTRYSFDDRMMVADSDLLKRLDLKRTPKEERDADDAALKLLRNSPYKDQLGQAGLFLEALTRAARNRPRLLGAQLGNRLMDRHHELRMAQLMEGAPKLEPRNLDQIAALPLGSRIVLNPWNDDVRLAKAQKAAFVSAADKMPFDVTPLFPYLTRYGVAPPVNQQAAEARP